MTVLKVAVDTENDTISSFHRLDVLLDDFDIEYLTPNASFTHAGLDNPTYELVETGLAHTVGYGKVPSLSLMKSFTFSNVFGQSTHYLLYAKELPCTIDINRIMANMDGTVFLSAVTLVLLLAFVQWIAFIFLNKGEMLKANVNWWTLLMVTLPCFNCQGVVDLKHHNRGMG